MFGNKRSAQLNPTSSCGMFLAVCFLTQKKENPKSPHTDSQMPLGRLYVFFKPEQSSGYGSSLRNEMVGMVTHGAGFCCTSWGESKGNIHKNAPPASRLFRVCQISGFFFRWTFQKTIPCLDIVNLSPSIVLNEQKIRIEFLFEKCEYICQRCESVHCFFPIPLAKETYSDDLKSKTLTLHHHQGPPQQKLSGFEYFWNFHADAWGRWTKFDEHMFQVGGAQNHQL